MRNFKRTLALVLALVMIVGTFATVSAANASWYQKAIDKLDGLGISNIGNAGEEYISRNEFVLWIAKIELLQMSDNAWKDKITSVDFTDVTDEHYNAAIAYAHKNGYIIGNGDGTFGPDQTLTLGEAAAVIVRLMRYEDKLIGQDEGHWAIPYMTAAQRYCMAFDQTFLSKTDTSNPDFQIKKGEAAYLLYTILNFGNTTGKNLILTADGTNLGTRFEGLGNTMARGEVYTIYTMDRENEGTSYYATGLTSVDAYGTFSRNYSTQYSNTLTGTVILVNTTWDKAIVISASEFMKAARVSIGLEPVRDWLNEEAEINVFEYFNIGTLVNVQTTVEFEENGLIDVAYVTDYEDLTAFSANANSVVVDTYLQMTSDNTKNTNPNYYGWSIGGEYIADTHDSTTAPNVPALPRTYDESNATAWSGVEYATYVSKADNPNTAAKNERKTSTLVSSAILSFRGVQYEYNYVEFEEAYWDSNLNAEQFRVRAADIDDSDIAIYGLNEWNEWVLLTVEEAMERLINAAQGECYAVFNDEDGDGEYDTVFVKESVPFYFASKLNIQPSQNTVTTPVLSSISNGQFLTYAEEEAFGADWGYGFTSDITKATQIHIKQNNLGSVITNRTVGYTNSGGQYSSDAYNLTEDEEVNKLQLVVVGSNSHPAPNGYASNNKADELPQYYTVVDLADTYTGIINKVSVLKTSDATDDIQYFTAQILCTDGETRTIYIPVENPGSTELDVTIAGATATYTFSTVEWMPFLDEATDAGIGGDAEDMAHWMGGKYVRFAVNEDNIAVWLVGTEETSEVGFVNAVSKTSTGDNTYNVTITTLAGTAGTETVTYFRSLGASSAEYGISYADIASRVFLYSGDDTGFLSAAITKINTLTEVTGTINGHNVVLTGFGESAVKTADAAGTPVTDAGELADIADTLADLGYVNDPFTAKTFSDIYNDVSFWAREDTLVNGEVADTTYLLPLKSTYTATRIVVTFTDSDSNATETIVLDNLYDVSALAVSAEKEDSTGYWYFVDINGNKFVKESSYTMTYGTSAVVTREVRAAASGAFNIGSKELYNAIFTAGKLIDLDVDKTGAAEVVTPVEDLIYVRLVSDVATNYVLAGHGLGGNEVVEGYTDFEFGGYYWEYDATVTHATPNAWIGESTNYIVSITENGSKKLWSDDTDVNNLTDKLGRQPININGEYLNTDGTVAADAASVTDGTWTADAKAKIAGYEATYTVVYGQNPYYEREYNTTTHKFEYVLKFETVIENDALVGRIMFAVDAGETKLVPLYKDDDSGVPVQVVVVTEADKAKYPANEYYIDKNGKVYILWNQDEVVFLTTTATADPVYDWESGTAVPAGTDVAFDDATTLGLAADTELAVYANLTAKAAPSDMDGWFPGYYILTIGTGNDATEYVALASTKLVLVTPSENGFDIKNLKLSDINGTKGLFITEWDANSTDGSKIISTITVIGEMVDKAQTPEVSTPDDTNTNRLVALNVNAQAYIRFDAYSDEWIVVSDMSAIEIPSGKDVGVIYKSYTTYTDAEETIADLDIVGGNWYYIDENNEIVGANAVNRSKAKITSASYDGTLLGEINGKEDVRIDTMDVVFLYNKNNGELAIAGSNKNVTITLKYADTYKTETNDYNTAKTNYETAYVKYLNKQLSAERLDYYKNIYYAAAEALAAKMAQSEATYRNGQFWGHANNAIYKYMAMQQGTLMVTKPVVNFEYVMVGDTMCVFVDSFK